MLPITCNAYKCDSNCVLPCKICQNSGCYYPCVDCILILWLHSEIEVRGHQMTQNDESFNSALSIQLQRHVFTHVHACPLLKGMSQNTELVEKKLA